MARIDPRDPYDRAWREATRALKRRPHRSKKMLSMNSLGQMKSWYCPDCSRFGSPIVQYSVTTSAPLCDGGKEFL